MKDSDIILIGPIGAGKSTVGVLLSDALEMDLLELDDLWLNYADEMGYDAKFVSFLRSKGGFWAVWMYNKEFYCRAVERILEDHDDSVFAFGAGHSVFETPSHLSRAQAALAKCRNVILLLPSRDVGKAREKLLSLRPDMPNDVKEHILTHPSNQALATVTVYTEGKSPEETRDEVLRLIDSE